MSSFPLANVPFGREVLYDLHRASPDMARVPTFHALFRAYITKSKKLPQNRIQDEITKKYETLIFPDGNKADKITRFINRRDIRQVNLDRRRARLDKNPLWPIQIYSSNFEFNPDDLDTAITKLNEPEQQVTEILDIHALIFKVAKEMKISRAADIISNLENDKGTGSLLAGILTAIERGAQFVQLREPRSVASINISAN